MTLNFSYPLQAKIHYSYDGLFHVHSVGLNPESPIETYTPGMDLSENILIAQNGTTMSFVDWVDVYMNGSVLHVPSFKGLTNWFSSGTTFDRAELWKYEEGSNVGIFIGVISLGTTGTAIAAAQPCGQAVYTFRTFEGGIARIQLMEGSQSNQTSQSAYGALGLEEQKWLTWQFLSTGSAVIAKDGSRLVSFIKRSFSQNEALFKRRFRS